MQLYTLGLSTLEGGVLWVPGSRTFQIVLLTRGSTGFSAGNATVTAALAQGNNTALAATSRIDLEFETRELSPGVRQIRLKSTNQIRDRDFKATNAGIVYQLATDDTDSVPIFFLSAGELVALAGGDGFTYNTPDTGIEQTEVRSQSSGVRTFLNAGVKLAGTLAIDATAEKFQITTPLIWHAGGMQFIKAPTVELVFSAAHPVTASKFGVILIQISNDGLGTVSTKIPGATQTTTMAYNTAPLALAALPAATAGSTAIGYIAIENNAGAWTANTDDLTDASDLTTAAFVDATVVAFPSAVS